MKKMETLPMGGCACSAEKTADVTGFAAGSGKNGITVGKILQALVALGVWYAVYSQLLPVSHWATFSLLGIEKGSQLGEAVQFFLYDTPKVLLLLTLVVFGVGVLRTFFTPERSRAVLAGKRESLGNALAALLGIATPFCSCSAVPLFIGFVTAGVPLGVTFSFLIAAPMINEVAVVLLFGLLGWKVAALYVGTGLAVAIVAGWIIGRLRMERYIESWVLEMRTAPAQVLEAKLTWAQRFGQGWLSVKDIVGKVWIFVVLGIAVGAAIHGYVPEGMMVAIMGKSAWWSVPAAVVMGIPMYSNAAGMVPILEALIGKGAALGTALAFMMSVIALSLPEMVILRKVLKPRLIGVFIAVVGSGILLVGYLFNVLIG